MTPSYLTLLDRSSEHLAVSVTLAWLNNGGNEDGGSCLAQRRGLEPLLQFCLFRQIHVPNPIQSRSSPQTVVTPLFRLWKQEI
ncbi:unnamed protein product [Brassica oleracea]